MSKRKRKGNYGHPIDEDTRRRISESVKKRWQDKEYQEKVSKAHSHPLPKEWKQNISNGMQGMKRSKETRKKMSVAQKKSHERQCVKDKQSKAWKKQWNSLDKEQQFERLKPWIEAGHKASISSIELKVKEQLDYLGIKYIQQKHIHDKKNQKHYYADFYIPSLKLVIECNGEYWHSEEWKNDRDKNLKKFVEKTGHKIIFIWEYEIIDEFFWIGDYLDV